MKVAESRHLLVNNRHQKHTPETVPVFLIKTEEIRAKCKDAGKTHGGTIKTILKVFNDIFCSWHFGLGCHSFAKTAVNI